VNDLSRPASRRYLIRLSVVMALYMAALFGAVAYFNGDPAEGWIRYAVAIAPALPAIAVFWAVGMYLHEEEDEYLRYRLVRVSLMATAITLGLATAWGFLEQFGTVPHIPAYYAFVIYWASLGVSQIALKVLGK
jgi:hypothetical protein